jgi:tripartite-type tricarboxylate transporter receptor subunit TctC
MLKKSLMAAALMLTATLAGAQAYPTKSITAIVPYAAGGPADTLMRNVAIAMSKPLGQTVVVENVGGASGNIGRARGAKATPDGYTILYDNMGFATAPLLYRNLEFNPLTDFDYIGLVASSPNVLVSRSDFPPNNFKELLAYVKANQDKVTMADAGPGGVSSLCGLLFMAHTGTTMTAVPYKGTGPAMNDLVGKQVDLLCDSASTAAAHIKSGRVKAFGLTGKSRLSALPGVPSLDEQGLKGFDMVVWQALFAPKRMPPPALDRLVVALQASLSDPGLLAALEKISFEPVSRDRATPTALQAFLKSEIDKWGPIIKKAGIVLN